MKSLHLLVLSYVICTGPILAQTAPTSSPAGSGSSTLQSPRSTNPQTLGPTTRKTTGPTNTVSPLKPKPGIAAGSRHTSSTTKGANNTTHTAGNTLKTGRSSTVTTPANGTAAKPSTTPARADQTTDLTPGSSGKQAEANQAQGTAANQAVDLTPGSSVRRAQSQTPGARGNPALNSVQGTLANNGTNPTPGARGNPALNPTLGTNSPAPGRMPTNPSHGTAINPATNPNRGTAINFATNPASGATSPTGTTSRQPATTSTRGALTSPATSVQVAHSNAETSPAQHEIANGNSDAAKTGAPRIPGAPPPDTSIAGARAKGLVWVDLSSKVYHTPGDTEYGTTMNGKFMTQDDAKAAGAKMAGASPTN